jgi:hypothetical protein
VRSLKTLSGSNYLICITSDPSLPRGWSIGDVDQVAKTRDDVCGLVNILRANRKTESCYSAQKMQDLTSTGRFTARPFTNCRFKNFVTDRRMFGEYLTKVNNTPALPELREPVLTRQKGAMLIRVKCTERFVIRRRNKMHAPILLREHSNASSFTGILIFHVVEYNNTL